MASTFINNAYDMAGALSANSVLMTFGGLSPQIVQSLNAGMSQGVTRLYEVGGVDRIGGRMRSYYVAGRTQGQASLTEVVGPKTDDLRFRQQFGDVCRARDNNISLAFVQGCSLTTAAGGAIIPQKRTMDMYACVLTQYSVTVQSGDNVINSASSMQFMDLDEKAMAL